MPMTKPTSEQVTFLAAGTGASQRTALDKLRDVVSVKDFGAVGDGVANDATAITNALAYLGTIGGGTLAFHGSHNVENTSFTIPSNVVLYGNGATIAKSSNGSNARIFIIRNVSNVEVRDFAMLDGNYTGVSTGSNPVIEIGDLTGSTSGMVTKNISITGNYIRNGNHALIGVYGQTDTGNAGVSNVFINGNTLERAGTGIFNYKGTTNLSICGNTMLSIGAVGVVLDTRAATDSNTTQSFPISDVVIANNILNGIGGDTGFQGTGMTLKGAISRISVTGNVIRNVTSQGSANAYGILIATSYGPGTGATASASLSGSSVNTISVGTAGSGYTQVPSVFISSGTGSGATATAVLSSGTLASVTVDSGGENYATAPFVQIIAGELPKNILIDGNIISSVSSSTGTVGWPVYVQNAARNVTITNNQIEDCKRGIDILAADIVTVCGNMLRGIPTGSSGLFPINIAGDSATAKATNIVANDNTIVRETGDPATSHGIGVNFASRVVLNDNVVIGFDNANKYSISATNAALVSGCIGSATYDPPLLADGAGVTATVTVNGAELGDIATASFSLDLQEITLTAYVSAANTVKVRFQNESGGPLDLGSGTLIATTYKP